MKPALALIFAALLFPIHVSADTLPQWLQQGMETARQANRIWVRGNAQASYTARVDAVSDGDSLRVTDSNGRRRKIRMAYIDAPELHQAYGMTARNALNAEVYGKTIEVNVFETDRYKREVAQVFLNGEDLNLKQIEQGRAWHYTSIARRKQNKADFAAYAYAEAAARQNRTGLWKNAHPRAPWDFRREAREAQSRPADSSGPPDGR